MTMTKTIKTRTIKTRAGNSQLAYDGSVQSGLRRARAVLMAAGYPMSKRIAHTTARGTRRWITTNGVNVSRVGCSDSFAVEGHHEGCRSAARQLELNAIATLIASGFPTRIDCDKFFACAYSN